MPSVLIQGDGVAASCCAHLLARSGLEVSARATSRTGLPAILLSDAALTLLRDVFEAPEMFGKAARIRKRIVMWGRDADAVTLDHSAIVISEASLLVGIGKAAGAPAVQADWSIFAARPLPDSSRERVFGSRMAYATAVELRQGVQPEACWIESVDDGWLFLVTDAPGHAWLLSVGGRPDELLGQSFLVALQVMRCSPGERSFPASPRMAFPISGPNWLACGTAALAFDPLCGDGTAHAVREAILACAAIRGTLSGGEAPKLLSHYDARLTAAFRKHLELNLRYYETGGTSAWWQGEAAAARQGLVWCDNRLRQVGAFSYRLNGFELERIV